ncbi:MAG: dephospho-CoA kinase [Bacteroidales bacterium]|nr:dephospho-CoA kinase [Candidatus Hennigimonas equi]
MKIIVVTGGIGSGKSTVCRYLERCGIPVYDCDSRAKALYVENPALADMVTADIFRNSAALSSLENALYPLLMEDFRKWVSEREGEFVAVESAVILQKKFFDSFGDYVLLVDAPAEDRMARVALRGNVSRESLVERMALQQDQRHNPRVNSVIDNTGDEIALEEKVNEFLKEINYGKREN